MNQIVPVPFEGAGGLFGGGSSASANSTAVRADTIASTDQIEVILALGSGPIKGLSNGLKSFYIGDTQYQNNDGSFNFELFDVEVLPGNTPGEIITPVLGGYEDYYPGVQALNYNGPVVFRTLGSAPTQVIVRIKVSVLYYSGTDAQLTPIVGVTNTFNQFLPNAMYVQLGYRTAGSKGAFIDPFSKPYQIIAKTQTAEYHEIRFTTPIPGPIEVSVENLTANANPSFCTAELEGHYEVTGGVFGETRSNTVNTTLAEAVQVVRTTDYPPIHADGTYGIDFICVRIVISALYNQDPKQGVIPAQVQYLIEFKGTSSTTWVNPFNGPITMFEKISKGTSFDYRWAVPPTQDTYDVRVTLITPNTPAITRQVTWESLEEIVGGPIKFDGVAVVHLVGSASNQFTSVPDFWGIYDLKLVRLPSNYDPYLRTYAGVWDGTFKIDWTSNPAWCMYDLGMSEEYGLRKYWPVFSLDKWDTYAAGQWCDQPVSDGQGGFQPRYTFNGVIVDPRGALEQLRYMAGVFNGGFLDDMNGITRVVHDHDEAASAVFTPENVLASGFNYTYTDITTRHNSIRIKFNDPNLKYQVNTVEKQDLDHIARFGANPLEIVGVGCTNMHEASRRATFKLLTATTEKEIVSFITNRQGLMIHPFSVILISDPIMGNGITGRIKSIDQYRQTIYLRDEIFFELGIVYVFRTHATNPNYPATSIEPLMLVEIPFYAPVQGNALAFELAAPLPDGVFENAQFSLGCEGNTIGVPKPYRVTKIEELDGSPDSVTIEAIEINRNKWLLSDSVTNAVALSYTGFPADLPAPTNLTVVTDVVSINGALLANVTFTWTPPKDARVNNYQVQYRLTHEVAWIDLGETPRERLDLYNIPDGVYDFRVRSIASAGLKSLWVASYAVPAGLNVPPDDVQGLELNLLGDNLYLTWDPVHTLNLSYYWTKFTPLIGADANWENATDLQQRVLAVNLTVAAQTGTYFVKAVNIAGQESANAAFANTSTQFLTHKVIYTKREDPLWEGSRYGVYLIENVLKLNPAQGSVGTYFWHGPDFGEPLTCRINMELVIQGELDNNVIADWPTLASVTSLSGVVAQDYQAKVSIGLSQDGTDPGITSYKPFSTGDYKARSFWYRIEIISNKPHVVPSLRSLSTTIAVPARAETGKNIFVPTQGLTVVFNPPFKVIPTFSITPKNSFSGDYFVITDESVYGFTISYYNAASNAIGRFIDYQALGFGGH